ncbi:MAG: hypothetical protein ACK4PI_01580 [Tepidisphaerales bacterium]
MSFLSRRMMSLGMVGFALGVGTTASAQTIVTPMMGGGLVGMGQAPMLHADVFFDGVNLTVHLDDTVPTPKLRPLPPGYTFINPTNPAPWEVLEGKAYNFQYAWNPGGFISLPAGAGIWVERLHHDPGLETWLRPPAQPAWTAVFQNDGDRWRWGGAMSHNAYAVLNPLYPEYTAVYRVYIGDFATGVPLPGYGSATVTWTWVADPVPEPSAVSWLGVASLGLLRRRRV